MAKRRRNYQGPATRAALEELRPKPEPTRGSPWIYGVVAALVVAVLGTVIVRISGPGSPSSEALAQGSDTRNAARGIVVVDAQAALQAFMAELELRVAAGEEMTEAQLQMQGADFGAEFLRAVVKYRDAGYLVLDRGQVLAVPEGADITMEIGDALGLAIVARDDPFASPKIR